LPDYKYIKRLGSGAFAVVHLVENRETGEQFALKKVFIYKLCRLIVLAWLNMIKQELLIKSES
jgi:hypothetical protein